jgi:hypothetical protein
MQPATNTGPNQIEPRRLGFGETSATLLEELQKYKTYNGENRIINKRLRNNDARGAS